jgi:hypothetical protein
MKRLNERSVKVLFVLSIVVPISLLATFRLTGVLPEPLAIAETVTAETVQWNMTKPTTYAILLEKIENLYVDEAISINFTLIVGSYHENEPDFPSYRNDYIKFGIITTANASHGFIYSVNIQFSRTDVNAILYLINDPNWIQLQNLRIEKAVWTGTSEREAYIAAMGVNQPENCRLDKWSFWVLLDPNNTNHSLKATAELVYFNGVAYRKVVVPIQIEVLTP